MSEQTAPKPKPQRGRPLICKGVYGKPQGDGLDRLAMLLVEIGMEELVKGNLDSQPSENSGELPPTEDPRP